MLKNVEAKTLPRVDAVASSPEVLDQLLLRRLAGKVSRCLALEFHEVVNFPLRWNFHLPRSSRAILKKMNPQLKGGIMAGCKLMSADKRREYRAWT
jgi:hypothetical protein